ncbi:MULTISPECIES: hypothetical protein [Flavobacterium]|uniref:Uncharacterized protein n=1 Tax=Flavobacterium jumunjinense TaxID=998845 RepID=A0ABV5GHS1_9FLAO|nr:MULTISPECIES: hypothetical protein [Flavobacterium]
MKSLILTALLSFSTLNIVAQNKNVKKETKTVTKTIKDSKGEQEIVKTIETKETQNVELALSEQKGKNIPIKEEAKVDVTKTTKIKIDGETKFIDIDQSAYYNLNGRKYQIIQKGNGYSMMNSANSETGVLRKTSNNNYIFRSKDKVSFGYLDNEGNLILETFDYKNDQITMEKFTIEK